MSNTVHLFALVTLISVLAFLSIAQISFAQTNDDLYGAIASSLGSDDDGLVSELARAAAAAGITVEDITDPLPPILGEEGTFVEETFPQDDSSADTVGGLTANFVLVAFGVGLIIFITLIIALARRFKHEKERIDRERALQEQVEIENSHRTSSFNQ
jgi:hypothetical protein